MQIKDLRPNKRNPRRITSEKKEMLRASLEKFGDLGCFLYNRRTKNMFGAHQRASVIPPNSTIKIEHKYDMPTKTMTVAEGYVLFNGERLKYREVDADEEWEMEAMLAANQHSGDWDTDILKLNLMDFPKMDLKSAGFTAPDLKSLGLTAPKLNSNLSPIPSIKDTEEETDEDYVKNTPQISEQIQTGEASLNAFDGVDEKVETKNIRHIVIIDCPTKEMKEDLREKLRPQVIEAGAKIF